MSCLIYCIVARHWAVYVVLEGGGRITLRLRRGPCVMADNEKSCTASCDRFSDRIVGTFAGIFQRIGHHVATYPIWYIVSSIVFSACFVPGVTLYFYEEIDADKLWLPKHSHIREERKIVNEYFPSRIRIQETILVSRDHNVLTKEFILDMLDLDQKIRAAADRITGNVTYESISSVVNNQYQVRGLLEVWAYNATRIRALTDDDIIRDVSALAVSPISGLPFDPTSLLFGWTRNRSGVVTEAMVTKTEHVLWMYNDGSPRDSHVLEFEVIFRELLLSLEGTYASFDEIYFNNQQGYAASLEENSHADLNLLLWGLLIISIFVCLVLGGCSLVHHRFLVAVSGLVCVGMSLLVTIGLFSYIGVPFGPVHDVLPFLIVGIGVDGMFVITASLDQSTRETPNMPAVKRIAHAMHHAGIPIAITTFTDVVAFGLGIKAHLPVVSYFCYYAMMGIFTLYLFTITFFLPCLSLDEKRMDNQHNAFLVCVKHPKHKPSPCYKIGIVEKCFEHVITPWLQLPFSKFLVVGGGLALTGVMAYGVSQMPHFYDPLWTIPYGDPAYLHARASQRYFPPVGGIDMAIYTGHIDYYKDKNVLQTLAEDLDNDKYIVQGSVHSWYQDFLDWMESPAVASQYAELLDADTLYPTNSSNFYSLLDAYSTAPDSPGYRDTIHFALDHGTIAFSRINAAHVVLADVGEEIAAMNQMKKLSESTGYNSHDCFAYAFSYGYFEINEVMKEELLLHLSFGFAAVFLAACLLIANPGMCLLILVIVFMTLVDIGGTLYFIGRTIDSYTALNMILAIGLAIDYPVHVGHAFMNTVGKTRSERVVTTLNETGPVVFYGALSTFLSFLLLNLSTTYKYNTFFEVFSMVVGYGTFNSLFVMTAVLSWIGPAPYLSLLKGNAHQHHNGTSDETTSKNDYPIEPADNAYDNVVVLDEKF